jgi:hypothetical protein
MQQFSSSSHETIGFIQFRFSSAPAEKQLSKAIYSED